MVGGCYDSISGYPTRESDSDCDQYDRSQGRSDAQGLLEADVFFEQQPGQQDATSQH